jgi:hypothetical protein
MVHLSAADPIIFQEMPASRRFLRLFTSPIAQRDHFDECRLIKGIFRLCFAGFVRCWMN